MDKYVSADTIWVLIGAFLVFSMQPGFAMVETGFTRAKNAGNIVMKNVMDMCLGSIVFWVLGFGLMFGTDIGGFIGAPFVGRFYLGPLWTCAKKSRKRANAIRAISRVRNCPCVSLKTGAGPAMW